jgi:hypothetical protein
VARVEAHRAAHFNNLKGAKGTKGAKDAKGAKGVLRG